MNYFNPQPKPVKKKKTKKPYYFPKGQATKDWDAAKRILKPAFAEVGICYCEVGAYLIQFKEHFDIISKHNHHFFLTWAHGDKREKLVGNELVTLVALCCQACHDYIEYRADMREIIEAVIASRKIQPKTYYLTEGE